MNPNSIQEAEQSSVMATTPRENANVMSVDPCKLHGYVTELRECEECHVGTVAEETGGCKVCGGLHFYAICPECANGNTKPFCDKKGIPIMASRMSLEELHVFNLTRTSDNQVISLSERCFHLKPNSEDPRQEESIDGAVYFREANGSLRKLTEKKTKRERDARAHK